MGTRIAADAVETPVAKTKDESFIMRVCAVAGRCRKRMKNE